MPGILETAPEVLVPTSDAMQSPSGSLLGMSLPSFGMTCDFCNTLQKSPVTQFTPLQPIAIVEANLFSGRGESER